MATINMYVPLLINIEGKHDHNTYSDLCPLSSGMEAASITWKVHELIIRLYSTNTSPQHMELGLTDRASLIDRIWLASYTELALTDRDCLIDRIWLA